MAAQQIQGNTEVLKQNNQTGLMLSSSETSKSPLVENQDTKVDASLVGTMQALTCFTGTVIKGDDTTLTTDESEDDDLTEDNDLDTDTSDDNPFSTSNGHGGVMGGSLVAYIAASTVEQQGFLLQISSDYLAQYGLAVEASNTSALAQKDILEEAAQEQKAAGMSDAYQQYTAGACSTMTASYTLGTWAYSNTGGRLSEAKTQIANAESLSSDLHNPEIGPRNTKHELQDADYANDGGYHNLTPNEKLNVDEVVKHKKANNGDSPNPSTLTPKEEATLEKEYQRSQALDWMKANKTTQVPTNSPDKAEKVTYMDNGVEKDFDLSADDAKLVSAQYKKDKIAAIKEDIITQGVVSSTTTAAQYQINGKESTRFESFRNGLGKMGNKTLSLTGGKGEYFNTERASSTTKVTTQDEEAQIAIQEIKAERTTNPKQFEKARDNTQKSLEAARANMHAVTQDITWHSQLGQSISGALQGMITGTMKMDQARHQEIASQEQAAAGVYGANSSSMSQAGGMYANGSSSLVQQANSELSSVMDAARRASAKN